MAIEHLDAHQVTVFKDVSVDFSPGINVVIGENGTGKSHLLRLLYASTHTLFEVSQGAVDTEILKAELLQKPDELSLGRLVQRRRGRSTARVAVAYDSGLFTYRYTTQKSLYIDEHAAKQKDAPIFIPSREALAIYKGFVQAYENRELAFDETYRDICVALSGSQARGPRQEKIKRLVNPLEEQLGGRVVLQDDRFVVKLPDGSIEAHLLAEGLRKIASIVHLINNGSLTERSILFWDEPEANLNPRLIKLLCEVLRKLAVGGMQIFLASHDYLLTHELGLAARYNPTGKEKIRFFAHSRDEEGNVAIESADQLAELEHNAILEEFAAHYDREADFFVKPEGA